MLFPFRDFNPTNRIPVLTYAIVVINVVVLLVMSRQDLLGFTDTALHYGFVPARVAQLKHGQPVVIDLNKDPHVQQVIGHPVDKIALPPDRVQIAVTAFTHMFMHGGWFHLISNMWFLIVFGNNIEDRLGHVAYLCFYFLGGLAAMLCHYLSDPGSTAPVIGASGAVAAVLGAYLVTFPTARVRCLLFLLVFITIVDLPAYAVLGFWFVLQLLEAWQTVGMPGVAAGVAWWAHVGGFVAGCLLMPLIALGAPPPGHSWKEDDHWHDDDHEPPTA